MLLQNNWLLKLGSPPAETRSRFGLQLNMSRADNLAKLIDSFLSTQVESLKAWIMYLLTSSRFDVHTVIRSTKVKLPNLHPMALGGANHLLCSHNATANIANYHPVVSVQSGIDSLRRYSLKIVNDAFYLQILYHCSNRLLFAATGNGRSRYAPRTQHWPRMKLISLSQQEPTCSPASPSRTPARHPPKSTSPSLPGTPANA